MTDIESNSGFIIRFVTVAKDKMRAGKAIATVFYRQGKRTAYPLQVACIVFPALLFSTLAWIDYRAELQHAHDNVETTTDALAEHAQTVAEAVGLVLDRVLEHIGQDDWDFLAGSQQLHEFLSHLQQELPQVEAIFLVDPKGLLAASSRGYPVPRVDLHQTDYFATPQRQDNDEVVIGAPSADNESGTPGFMVTRRRVRDGHFDGVVGVTISQRYFCTFYQAALNHLAASTAGLIRTDGTVLVRYPGSPGSPNVLNAANPILRSVQDHIESGILNGRSNADHVRRIIGFRRLRHVPLVVAYSINLSVAMQRWLMHALVMAASASVLSLLLLATESVVRRKAANEHDSLCRLVEETERRRRAEATAQQSQKMEAIGRLTGGVAHDFNNLLAVILISLELALLRNKDARTVKLLQTATDSARRGAKLTSQMLAFSRKQDIVIASVDVNQTIRDMDNLLHRTLGPAVRLHYDLADNVWPVLADQVQLEMALLNLAVNARDAMPDGGELSFSSRPVTLSESVPTDLTPGDYVCVQVADTGTGMSEDVRRRAHEPFYTTKDPGRGTGLGLSMVYGFVRALGGAVSFDSTVGAGTTVTVFLRRAAIAPSVPVAQSDSNPWLMKRGRMLVVDDDASVRFSICTMLKEQGHDVVEVAGGAEALAVLARDRRFDLLIVDYAMPVMNGSQLAVAVTRLWPGAPLLFVTGYVENDGLRDWSDRGYDTLLKPFSAREMAVAIERARRCVGATAS